MKKMAATTSPSSEPRINFMIELYCTVFLCTWPKSLHAHVCLACGTLGQSKEASIADQDTQPVSWHIVTGCFRWEHTCYHPKLLSQTCSSIPKATPEELKQARSKAKAKPKPAAAKSKPRAPPSPQPSPPAKGTPNPAPTKRVRGKQHEPDDHDTASSGSGQRDQAQMIQDLMEALLAHAKHACM